QQAGAGRPDRRPAAERRRAEDREGRTQVDRAAGAGAPLRASFCREREELLDGTQGGRRDHPERARAARPEGGPQQREEDPERCGPRTTHEEQRAHRVRETGPIERAEGEEQYPGGQAVRGCATAAPREAVRVVGGQRRARRLWAWLGPGSRGGIDGHRFLSGEDRKSTRLNSSHGSNSYAVFCLKKKM